MGRLGCFGFLGKYILFLSNLFFVLAGIALIVLGVLTSLRMVDVSDIFENLELFDWAPIIAIVAGCLVFLVAFLGCCGAIRESNSLLITYVIVLLILMVLKITLSILIFVEKDDFLENIPRWLLEAFIRNPTNFQKIERSFECCGPMGPGSYVNLPLPDSCCFVPPCTLTNAHDGCNIVVDNVFYAFGLSVAAVAIVVAAFEFVAAMFSICFSRSIRKSRTTF